MCQSRNSKLDLVELAGVSNFSAFHFHRIMRAHLNESIGSYIFRVRLDTAAGLIRYSGIQLNEIAEKVGYECPSSFSKAFRKRFNISPQEFRDSGIESRNYDVSFDKSEVNMELKTKIKELNDKKVVFIQSIGEYSSVKTGETWDKLMSYAKKNRLFGWKTECLGISHDDPSITEADKCRYDACLVVTKDVKPDGEVGVKTIQGGKYAIFKVTGP
ncbi:MAG: helix-turn-helix domain-containing protein [Bacteroidia bacterium]|nr:helix-turn-helix domain-containing protein [Bacteroidia bacterium]